MLRISVVGVTIAAMMKLPLLYPDNFHHCGDRDPDHRYSQHVRFCGSDDRALRPEHRHRLPRASQAAQSSARQARNLMGHPALGDRLRLVYFTGAILLFVLPSAACSRQKSTAEAADKAPGSSSAIADASPAAPEPNGPLPAINAARAFQYTKEVTGFGPRPIGSANHKKLENYIYAHLKGDEVVDDVFTADTPEGKFPARNIIAKYPGTRDGIIVIAGHYDTPYNLRSTPFVGANDGGSSTGILLEFANQFRGKKRDGYSVWLVWTDAEEAVRQWSATDSRQLASGGR